MNQNVLDGVMAIEASAAHVVDEARDRARQLREKVKTDLAQLAEKLDAEAEAELATYTAEVQKKNAAELEALDRQLSAALAAVDKATQEGVPARVEEVVRLLEQRANGD